MCGVSCRGWAETSGDLLATAGAEAELLLLLLPAVGLGVLLVSIGRGFAQFSIRDFDFLEQRSRGACERDALDRPADKQAQQRRIAWLLDAFECAALQRLQSRNCRAARQDDQAHRLGWVPSQFGAELSVRGFFDILVDQHTVEGLVLKGPDSGGNGTCHPHDVAVPLQGGGCYCAERSRVGIDHNETGHAPLRASNVPSPYRDKHQRAGTWSG